MVLQVAGALFAVNAVFLIATARGASTTRADPLLHRRRERYSELYANEASSTDVDSGEVSDFPKTKQQNVLSPLMSIQRDVSPFGLMYIQWFLVAFFDFYFILKAFLFEFSQDTLWSLHTAEFGKQHVS